MSAKAAREITLRQAARYWRRDHLGDDVPDSERLREVQESTAVLEALLAAGRRGKTVRQQHVLGEAHRGTRYVRR